MFSWWKLVARCVLKFTCSYWNLEWKKSHHACFQHGFCFVFSFYVLCIPTKKTKQKNVDEQALRTRKECSVSITQQKHKMEEIQFCSKVWEKHLEESWWVRDRESDAEGGVRARKTEIAWEVIYQPLSLWDFFSQSEFFTACWDGLLLCCREVNGYLLHGYKHWTNRNVFMLLLFSIRFSQCTAVV